MKYLFSIIILFLFSGVAGFAQTPDSPTFRLFLIGDAGEDDSTEATLRDLGVMLKKYPNSAVVFLGDNCYKKAALLPVDIGGFDGSEITRMRMMSQLNILRGYKGSAFFVPGNHDWWNKLNLKKAVKWLKMQQAFIDDTLKSFKTLRNHETGFNLPANGVPGPVSRDFNDGKTRIIFIDTYWLIIKEDKKDPEVRALLDKFYDDLKDQLNDASKKKEKIIVVGHHPILAKGNHSLPMALWQRLVKRFADSNTNYPPYGRMAVRLDSLLKAHHHPDVYYVSGHEHSLEYFSHDSLQYIVSGAGCKVDNVVHLESCQDANECLQWNEEGFFEIEFYGRFERVLMYHRRDAATELKQTCIAGCK